MNYFVTAIGTDSGKTLISAILCEALGADYWKPIQAGLPKDSDTVKSLLSNAKSVIHKETHLLKTPASPHEAARIDGVDIQLHDFVLPNAQRDLIIEGAGGCLVPVNDNDFVIDIATHLSVPVVLVSNLYLGSINHTLLTVNLLKQMTLRVKGIIFNGVPNKESEEIILKHSGYKCLLRVLQEAEVNKETVRHYAGILKENWL